MKNHTVYISVGSNIGDKLDNCQKNINILAASPSVSLKVQSRFYKTEPVDYTDQDWFVNAAIKIETFLEPFELLKKLKSIENDAGRTDKSIRFGPRVIDLDIILFDDIIVNTPELTIPHPRMHKRCFVLRPLCDIAPDIIHPVLKKNIKYLLDTINDKDQRVILFK